MGWERVATKPSTAIALDRYAFPMLVGVSFLSAMVSATATSLASVILRGSIALLMITLLVTAIRPREALLSRRSVAGIILSFGMPWFFVRPELDLLNSTRVAGNAVFLFYTGILIWAYFSLGSSMGVVPAVRTIKSGGAFAMVRHPIYSTYIHLATAYVFLYPGATNLLCLSGSFCGFCLRIQDEEMLLRKTDEYCEFVQSTKRCFFDPVLSLPVLLLGALALAD